MNEIKIKGIKKAVGDFNNWIGPARIYFDIDDQTVDTSIYANSNSADDCYKYNIIQIAQKATCSLAERHNTTTMAELKKICESILINPESQDYYTYTTTDSPKISVLGY